MSPKYYRTGAHTKYDLKAHIVWIPKYRKKILKGQIAIRVRDIIRGIALDNDIRILSGKVACDHVHIFISYRATQSISKVVQYFKGTSARILFQEFPHIKKQYWGRHLWSRGYLAVSSGTITDEQIQSYINEQEGEQIADDDQFPIDQPD